MGSHKRENVLFTWMFSLLMTATLENIPHHCVSHLMQTSFAYHVWSLDLFLIHTDLVRLLLCVCVCVFVVYFLCFCVSGLDSMLRTEGRRVSHYQQGTDREKEGLRWRSLFYTTAVGVKAISGVLGVKGMFQRAWSLTIATCRSHATPADTQHCPDNTVWPALLGLQTP